MAISTVKSVVDKVGGILPGFAFQMRARLFTAQTHSFYFPIELQRLAAEVITKKKK